MSDCTGTANLNGQHLACDMQAPHPGLGHQASAEGVALIWTDDPQQLTDAWAGAEAAGR